MNIFEIILLCEFIVAGILFVIGFFRDRRIRAEEQLKITIQDKKLVAQCWVHDAIYDQRRYPHVEYLISRHANTSYEYALEVIQGRFLLGEETIKRDGRYAYMYALYVLKSQWPEAEQYIQAYPTLWTMYQQDVVKK